MFYIEGNIGAGKSTFLTLFKQYMTNNIQSSTLLLEPVERWLNTKDSNGKHILQYYYEDQKKYGFAFQMNAFISRVLEIEEMKSKGCDVNFVERSVYTDKNVFTTLNYENGNIGEIELKVYEDWFKVLTEKFDVGPSGFIYLKTSPETCFQRIKKRSRSGESDIPLEYLEQLDILHTIWLEDEKKKGVKVLEIDVSEDYIESPEKQEEMFRKIKDFIEK